MSQIGNNVYPNTSFPDSKQTLPTFTDLSVADQTAYVNYLKQIMAGNITAANTYLNQITNTAIINANKMNILSDTIAAVQDLYSSTTTFSDIVTQKQSEWEALIKRFGYMGTWTPFNIYNNIAVYNLGDIVYYNNKVWRCKLNNTTTITPAENNNWTQYYYKNSLVGYTNSIDGRFSLYIANVDITNNSSPYNNAEWTDLVRVGDRGDNGVGFSFLNKWDSSVRYSTGNLVIYGNIIYMSLVSNNLNHTPANGEYWAEQFTNNLRGVYIGTEAPSDIDIEQLWFQIVE